MKLSPLPTMAIALTVLVPKVGATTVHVANCLDWEAAVEATLTVDTTAVITASTFSYEDCGESTNKTLEVKNNILAVESDTASRELCQFWGIRFEVTDNGRLEFEMSAEFNLDEDTRLEVDGGFLHVEHGSTARFLEDLNVTNFRTVCTRDGDYCGEIFEGGCVWNEGYFRVNGHATFTACDNDKIHDAVPGLGGAIYNGPDGSILFEGGVTVQDMFINDIGSDDAAIYNAGAIEISGDSMFLDIKADNFDGTKPGAAIYNEENATFTFNTDAAATFVECVGSSTGVGAVRNRGSFTFSGPANFTLCESAIYNVAGSIKLSDGSVFNNNHDEGPDAGGAITNFLGATLDIPDDITFTNNYVEEDPSCENIYYEESDGFTCGP